MKPEKPIWHAEQSHTGGCECSHNHRTREAAARCLPRLPRGKGYHGAFSMARVVAANDAAERADREQAEIEADRREEYGW